MRGTRLLLFTEGSPLLVMSNGGTGGSLEACLLGLAAAATAPLAELWARPSALAASRGTVGGVPRACFLCRSLGEGSSSDLSSRGVLRADRGLASLSSAELLRAVCDRAKSCVQCGKGLCEGKQVGGRIMREEMQVSGEAMGGRIYGRDACARKQMGEQGI